MREMKDSGIDWIGEIPAHWEVKRLKDITTLNPNFIGEDLLGNVSFVPMESLRCGQIDLQEISFSEAKGKYTYFANNDLLIAKVTPCFENGNIALAKNLKQGIGFGSSEIFVLRCVDISNNFLFYYSLSSQFRDNACATMCGVGGLKRISPLFMRTYQFAIPPIGEQQAIADYLEKKTAEIDKQISLLEQKQNAYAKLKQSLISEVVTRGLNPNAPLKDSGIDWIGEIPAHWEVIEVKTYCKKIFAGATPSTKEQSYWDGDIPWIPSGSCHNSLITSYSDTITEEGLKNSSTKLIKANTTVMAMTGATCANTGFLTFESCANQSVCAYEENPQLCFSKFLFYLLLAARKYILTFQTGGAQAGINVQDCSNLKVPFVPLEEQKMMANYLDDKLPKIDKNISLIDQKIKAYKRLKQSLIDEVVTGKRKI